MKISEPINLQKEDDDTKTRLGVSASMNEQRRGDESLRTFNAGFNGSGTQKTNWGDVTTQTSGGLTRDKNGSSMRVQSALGFKREDASGAKWSGNVTGRADSNRNTAFQGSLERATEVDDRKITSVGRDGLRCHCIGSRTFPTPHLSTPDIHIYSCTLFDPSLLSSL